VRSPARQGQVGNGCHQGDVLHVQFSGRVQISIPSTLAGQAGISGNVDGTGSAARFARPRGMSVDAGGNVYVADTDNGSIRKITPTGVVTTLAQ